MPEISVVMGVYNAPLDYIKKAVESIIMQSFRDFEFIIINDGSNYECMTYLHSLESVDSRICVYDNEKNMGLTYSLNKGINLAKGKYIARMDADDYCDEHRFEIQLNVLKKNKVDMVASNAYLFADDKVWGERCYPENITKKDFLKGSPVIHPTILVDRNKIVSIGLYKDVKRTIRCEDYDLFMRFIANNYSIYTIQSKLYYFREDIDTIKRRKYKYRVNEFKTRIVGYYKLKILFPLGIFYSLKPLIVGLLPKMLYMFLKRKKEKL